MRGPIRVVLIRSERHSRFKSSHQSGSQIDDLANRWNPILQADVVLGTMDNCAAIATRCADGRRPIVPFVSSTPKITACMKRMPSKVAYVSWPHVPEKAIEQS
jgi:hypothetical protein